MWVAVRGFGMFYWARGRLGGGPIGYLVQGLMSWDCLGIWGISVCCVIASLVVEGTGVVVVFSTWCVRKVCLLCRCRYVVSSFAPETKRFGVVFGFSLLLVLGYLLGEATILLFLVTVGLGMGLGVVRVVVVLVLVWWVLTILVLWLLVTCPTCVAVLLALVGTSWLMTMPLPRFISPLCPFRMVVLASMWAALRNDVVETKDCARRSVPATFSSIGLLAVGWLLCFMTPVPLLMNLLWLMPLFPSRAALFELRTLTPRSTRWMTILTRPLPTPMFRS